MNGIGMRWKRAVAAACALAMLCGTACKSREGVMARVNGRKILATELETYYRNQTAGQPEPSSDQAQALRLNILRELIDNEILLQRAEKVGLMATDQEVDDKLKDIKAPFSNEEFEQRLNRSDLEETVEFSDWRMEIGMLHLLERQYKALHDAELD